MIATVLSTISTVATVYYLVEPQLAASRMSAQTQADANAEVTRITTWNGNYIRVVNLNGKNVVVNYQTNPNADFFDPTKYSFIAIPDNCSVAPTSDNVGATLTCSGSGGSIDKKGNVFRQGATTLIGGLPCNSDLYPSFKPSPDASTLCMESQNPPPRLIGGHFDLDSYSAFSVKGLHTHMWSDDYGSSFEVIGSNSIDSIQGNPRSANTYIFNRNQKFIIGIVNGALSPGIRIKINNRTECSVSDYNKNCNDSYGPPVIYSLNSGVIGATQLTSLNITVDSDAITGAKIIPTSTGFVNTSQSTPGKNGEYRNGAMVIQLIAVDSCTISGCTYNGKVIPFYKMGTLTVMSTAIGNFKSYTSNGGTGLDADSSVLYELSMFWHAPGAIWNNSNHYVPYNPATVACYIKKQYPNLVPNAVC